MLTNQEIQEQVTKLVDAVVAHQPSGPEGEVQTALAVAGLLLLGNLLQNLNDVARHLAEIAENTAPR